MSQRLKGLEARVTMVGPNGVETSLGDVVSCEFTSMLDLLSEGLLGEGTERKDDIYRGVEGNFEIQIETQQYLVFMTQIENRAKRRIPSDTKFNLVCSLSLPNGENPRLLFEDIFFGETPTSIGGRDEYVTVTVNFGCSDYRKLF